MPRDDDGLIGSAGQRHTSCKLRSHARSIRWRGASGRPPATLRPPALRRCTPPRSWHSAKNASPPMWPARRGRHRGTQRVSRPPAPPPDQGSPRRPGARALIEPRRAALGQPVGPRTGVPGLYSHRPVPTSASASAPAGRRPVHASLPIVRVRGRLVTGVRSKPPGRRATATVHGRRLGRRADPASPPMTRAAAGRPLHDDDPSFAADTLGRVPDRVPPAPRPPTGVPGSSPRPRSSCRGGAGLP